MGQIAVARCSDALVIAELHAATVSVAYREFFQNLSKAVAEFNYPGGAGADHVRVGVAATYLHRT